MDDVMRAVRDRLALIEVDRLRVKPIVKITGEFWAQSTEGDGNFRMFEFLEREGAHVVLCSRDRKKINAAAKEIGAMVPEITVVPVVADLTRHRPIRAMVAGVAKRFGRIDILVTNAGGPPVGSFLELDDAAWQRGVDLTLLSTIRCIREVLPHMRKRAWGRIIAITSLTVRQPIDDLIISSTVRPGILGLAKILGNQFGREGILVNCVAPGFILTSRQRELSEARAKKGGATLEGYLEELGKNIPVGRLGRPEELADVIAFLASERSSYVNGTTVTVDGGFVKGLF
jgi:3-oxoacyl-[acyl-carrier protein] reductase